MPASEHEGTIQVPPLPTQVVIFIVVVVVVDVLVEDVDVELVDEVLVDEVDEVELVEDVELVDVVEVELVVVVVDRVLLVKPATAVPSVQLAKFTFWVVSKHGAL